MGPFLVTTFPYAADKAVLLDRPGWWAFVYAGGDVVPLAVEGYSVRSP